LSLQGKVDHAAWCRRQQGVEEDGSDAEVILTKTRTGVCVET